jgi:hypothetical protein
MSNSKPGRHAERKHHRTPMQWLARRRTNELTRIYRDQYPGGLPHNKLGVKYAKYMCRTMAFDPDNVRPQWLNRYVPWLANDIRDDLLTFGPHWYSAKSLAQHLELCDEDRERLDVRTIAAIDVTDEERKVINQNKHREAEERYRRKNGAKPQSKSLTRAKPWKPLGVSRATYYRVVRQFRDAPFLI